MNLPSGFKAVGVAAGLKGEGREDVALIVSDRPAVVAGVFTTNKFVAAPVQYCRRIVDASGPVRAVAVNAKNANAGTGERGMRDAQAMAARAAEKLGVQPSEVLVASTGVIGRPMPMDKINAGIDAAALKIASGSDPASATRAIMTTDTVPKFASRRLGGVTLAGMAKGAGMIHPGMATMLGFLMTDASVSRADLQAMLGRVATTTFNAVSVDNDMSTNDTLLLLANGAAGPVPAGFEDALREVCLELALAIVRDGEGATKVVTVRIDRAASENDAKLAADAVATSMLFKTAIHGADPNWGRILAAVGRSGASLETENVRIEIGGLTLFEKGLPTSADLEALRRIMMEKDISVRVDLAAGSHGWTAYTCDLSREYVSVNADYTT